MTISTSMPRVAPDPLQSLGLALLLGQEPQGEVDALDLSEPPFGLGARPWISLVASRIPSASLRN
ncbi:hypothetical protein [Micromonospora sp. ATCC 39149]|uniref:Uncharacterized protein n=1 Tax=Micromonospora carbonacea TaxID=47853 RepID=A0A7D6CAQ9_9ACTN|nr:hypothetical protein [Micromonospora sp. ATCC 39149]QLJ96245.1 hypothetical protein HZU44_11785 [Micromonospora carbonacea]